MIPEGERITFEPGDVIGVHAVGGSVVPLYYENTQFPSAFSLCDMTDPGDDLLATSYGLREASLPDGTQVSVFNAYRMVSLLPITMPQPGNFIEPYTNRDVNYKLSLIFNQNSNIYKK